MTARAASWLVAAAGVVAFGAAFFLRMDAAYGPLQLSLDPSDWIVLWELLSHGQIAVRVVVESAGVGVAAGAVPWLVLGLVRRASRARRDA